jgi:hypothetical protein
MPLSSRTIAIMISSAILIVGIIHLGVGIGLVAKYHGISDVFQQQLSLSGYNIFLGLCAIGLGIAGLIAILYELPLFSKILFISSYKTQIYFVVVF